MMNLVCCIQVVNYGNLIENKQKFKSTHIPKTPKTVLSHKPRKTHISYNVACPVIMTTMYQRQSPSFNQFSSVSVAQSCLTLCDPMNHSTPGLPVDHQLLEFTQTHVH